MILCPPDPLNLMSLILANQFWIDWDKYSLWEKTFQIIICSIFWPFYTETANNISSVNKYNSIQTINCTTRAIMRRRSPSVTGAVLLKQLGWELLIITKPNLLLSHSSYWNPPTGSENWKVFKRWIFSTLDGFDLLICEPAIPQIPTYFHLESSVHNMYEVNSPQRYLSNLSNLSCRWSSTNSLGCADFYRCLNVGTSRHYLICNLYSGLWVVQNEEKKSATQWLRMRSAVFREGGEVAGLWRRPNPSQPVQAPRLKNHHVSEIQIAMYVSILSTSYVGWHSPQQHSLPERLKVYGSILGFYQTFWIHFLALTIEAGQVEFKARGGFLWSVRGTSFGLQY